jgi:anaerobic selenocysteine-containing dehydrogenase
MTDTARYADLVLPATTALEHRFHVTDMGGGPAFHSNLVEVAPAQA